MNKQIAPIIQVELLQLAGILDHLATQWWEFWTQRERALAAIYADMLTQIVKLGDPEDVTDFYAGLIDSPSTAGSQVTLRLVHELQQLFSTHGES